MSLVSGTAINSTILAGDSMESSVKTSSHDSSVSKEKVNSIIQVAHAWQLKGSSYVNNERITFEGVNPFADFRGRFKKSLLDFSVKNNNILSQNEADLLCSALDHSIFKDRDLIFDDFKKEKRISLSSGFLGHRVVISFDGDYLLISNKGTMTRRPIEVYKINRNKVTKSDFKEIIKLSFQPVEEYNKWLNNIPQKFEATKDDLSLCIEQAYPLSSYQEVGNCVWENWQTSVYGIYMLNRLRDSFKSAKKGKLIDTANKTFLQWREFSQIQSLERFFCAHNIPSKPLPSMTETSKEESFDELITFEGIDQNILRKIFRQFWSAKPTSLEFKHKMDKLESEYFKTLHGFGATYAKAEKLYFNQMSKIPYIVKDLSKVWSPSILSTISIALIDTFLKPESKIPALCLLLPAYSHSLYRTFQLTRRYFAL